MTCMHDRHKTTKVCACVRVCVFKGFGVLSPGFGCAVVAAVWRDLHARQAQEYLLCVCVCVCVCVCLKALVYFHQALAVRWWRQFGVTCTHDRHKNTCSVCVCVYVCVCV